MKMRMMSLLAGVLVAGICQAALVGEWKFEGGNLTDSSGNGFDGTAAGSLTSVGGVEAGTDALEFGATSGYVSIPMAAFASVSNEMSIAFWTFGDEDNLGPDGSGSSVFGANDRLVHSHLPWNNGRIYFHGGGNTSNYIVSDASKYEGQWNYMVYTLNTTTGEKKVYINGVQDSPDWTGATTPISGILSFSIGRENNGGNLYYGKIDNFQLYDHAMSATEISNQYASVEVDFIKAVATATPDVGAPPLEVAFDGSDSDSNANIISHNWDFGDGNSDSGAMATNTYAASGEYTATLIIEDDTGRFATNTVDVTVNHFLTAGISATPMVGSPPLEVVFDASSSTSSTSIVSYDWTFGDGNTATGVSASNTYVMSGVYTAAVVVADSHGLIDTNTVVITVQDYLSVDLIATAEYSDISNAPSFFNNDLAQTEYGSSSGTGANESSRHAQLFNGSIGNTNGATGEDGEVRLTSGETITITFDTSVNDLGYDITEISSIAGWTTPSGGRANQGYGIEVTYVDGSTAVLADPEHWAPNNPAFYWTKVTIVETNGLAMATGVKSITFDISEDANANGVVIYREFDVLGVPSVPDEAEVPTIEYDNGLTQISWATEGEFVYSVQSNLNLAYGDWGTFTNVTGTPPLTTVVLPPKNQGAEFYRVIVE